jgi:general transcription factor 3C polypeptide 5 (transcription factor C subunit 1)
LLAPAGQSLSAGLSLRPNDPLVKKLVSKELAVQNVCLRVTIPKRTGRKRKRASNDAFDYHASEQDSSTAPPLLTANQLLRRLNDNVDTYTVQPVAPIKQTHRFRALPDFQLQAASQPVMRQIGRHLVNPTRELFLQNTNSTQSSQQQQYRASRISKST